MTFYPASEAPRSPGRTQPGCEGLDPQTSEATPDSSAGDANTRGRRQPTEPSTGRPPAQLSATRGLGRCCHPQRGPPPRDRGAQGPGQHRRPPPPTPTAPTGPRATSRGFVRRQDASTWMRPLRSPSHSQVTTPQKPGQPSRQALNLSAVPRQPSPALPQARALPASSKAPRPRCQHTTGPGEPQHKPFLCSTHNPNSPPPHCAGRQVCDPAEVLQALWGEA